MKTEVNNGIIAFYAKSSQEWRRWLEKNGEKQKSVWLIIFKKESGIPSVNYKEAVEEALCFGWIDSKPNKRDDKSYYQFFAKRNPKSKWSKLNKEKIQQLMQEGRMHKSGLIAIETAKQNGMWTALDEVDNHLIPHDLQEALNSNKAALKHFNDFPKSSRKIILEWIANSKRADTRSKRIKETVALAAKNIRANHYRQ